MIAVASIAAVILVVLGVLKLLQGDILFGVGLIVLACIIGPGGYSILR